MTEVLYQLVADVKMICIVIVALSDGMRGAHQVLTTHQPVQHLQLQLVIAVFVHGVT